MKIFLSEVKKPHYIKNLKKVILTRQHRLYFFLIYGLNSRTIFNSYLDTAKLEYRDTAELIPSNLKKNKNRLQKALNALKRISMKSMGLDLFMKDNNFVNFSLKIFVFAVFVQASGINSPISRNGVYIPLRYLFFLKTPAMHGKAVLQSQFALIRPIVLLLHY